MEKTCRLDECGKSFVSSDTRQKFCSSECKERHHCNAFQVDAERRAKKLYQSMKRRVGKHESYTAVELQITEDEFLEWAVPRLVMFRKLSPDGRSSVDRIISGNRREAPYSLDNIRIVDIKYNTGKAILSTILNRDLQQAKWLLKEWCESLSTDDNDLRDLVEVVRKWNDPWVHTNEGDLDRSQELGSEVCGLSSSQITHSFVQKEEI